MTAERTAIRGRWQILIGAMLVAAGLGTVATAQPSPKPALYFVAIGDVPAGMMDGLVSHFRSKFGVPITTLLPLGFDRATFDSERSQLSAEKVMQAVRYRYPRLGSDPQARVIGLTSFDMYAEQMREKWAFTFSLRSSDRRFAVVSYARMDPRSLGAAPDDALLQTRLRKMLTKNIGIMYFGLPASANPRSVLFRNVLGVDDLDRMTEDFDPKQE